MSLVAVFIPQWHTLFSPPEISGANLAPQLRGEAVVFQVLFLAFGFFLPSRIPSLKRLYAWAGWLGFGILLFYGGAGRVPVLNNPALGAVFVILCLGFKTKLRLAAGLIAALLTFSRSGLLAWGLGVALTQTWIWRKKVTWVGAIAVLGLGGWYLSHQDAQRLLMWSRFWDLWEWREWPTTWFGLGPGTFGVWYEQWQQLTLRHWEQRGQAGLIEMFHYLHNDYLQLLADFGVVGFSLIAASFLTLLNRCSYEKRVPLLVMMGVMVIYFPLHYPPTLLLMMLFVKEACDSLGQSQLES